MLFLLILIGIGIAKVAMTYMLRPKAYGALVLVLLISLSCPVLSHTMKIIMLSEVSSLPLAEHQRIHLHLLQHGQQSV